MGDDHGKVTRSRKIVFDRLWYRHTSCLDEGLLVGSIGIILPLDYTHCRIRICSLVTSWASCWCFICTAFTLSSLRTNPFATCLLCSKLSSHAKLSLIDYSVSILPANFHGWANMIWLKHVFTFTAKLHRLQSVISLWLFQRDFWRSHVFYLLLDICYNCRYKSIKSFLLFRNPGKKENTLLRQ